MMLPIQDSWDDCYALAELLKRQSLERNRGKELASDEEVEQAIRIAIADLRDRAEQRRKRQSSQ